MFFHKEEVNSLSDLKIDIDRLFTSQEIIRKIGNISDIEQICQITLSEIERKMGYSSASISIFNEEDNSVQLKYVSSSVLSQILKKVVLSQSSFDPIKIPVANEMTLTMKAIVNKEVIIDDDIPKFIVPPLTPALATVVSAFPNAKSMIALPIRNKSGIFGVLNFTMPKKASEIRENERRTLELFIDQVGLIIDNALKYDEISNFNKQLKIEVDSATSDLKKELDNAQSLYNLTANVSRSLDPFKVAQAAVNSIPQDKMLIGSVISRYYPDKNYVAPLVTSENQIAYSVRKLIGDFTQYGLKLDDPEAQVNMVVRVVKTETPMFTNNISEFFIPALGAQLLDPIAKILNIKSVATYPLLIRGRTIGALSFMIKEKNAEEIDANEKQLLQTYTNQIAIALENANLFAQSQEIQAKLEKTLKELEAARKHERDMIDIMGHELRTPMSIVRNALIMMDTQIKANPADLMDKIKKYVDIGVESARREVSLIETLLSATKTDGKGFQLILEKVDLNDIINNSIIAFKREADRKGLELTYQAPATPVIVYADKTRIQEIADNFVNNSIKYTMRGSVNIKVWEQEGFGYVSVKDTGIGISEEDLKKLGQKFFRARQYIDDVDPDTLSPEKLEVVRPGGTGLGLFVTFNLIKIMDGKLDVQSKIKEGSTFTFGMPIFSGQQTKQIERKVEPSE